MNFKILISIIIILASNLINCQTDVKFFTTFSYNNFSMKSLKKFQKSLQSDLQADNITAKVVENYPSFWGYQTGLLIPIKEHNDFQIYSGGFIGYTSTGGRTNYSDYSGEVKIDQIIDVINLGAVLGLKKQYIKNFKIKYQFSAEYCYSDLLIDFYSEIGDIRENEKLKFTSSSIGLDLSLIPTLKIWHIFVGLQFSYHFYIPSNLSFSKVEGAILQTSSGENIEVEWSGLRTGIQLEISL